MNRTINKHHVRAFHQQVEEVSGFDIAKVEQHQKLQANYAFIRHSKPCWIDFSEIVLVLDKAIQIKFPEKKGHLCDYLL